MIPCVLLSQKKSLLRSLDRERYHARQRLFFYSAVPLVVGTLVATGLLSVSLFVGAALLDSVLLMLSGRGAFGAGVLALRKIFKLEEAYRLSNPETVTVAETVVAGALQTMAENLGALPEEEREAYRVLWEQVLELNEVLAAGEEHPRLVSQVARASALVERAPELQEARVERWGVEREVVQQGEAVADNSGEFDLEITALEHRLGVLEELEET